VTGTLYVVATPIGNLEDITVRALRVLKEVDLIACEDTRHTRSLLTRYAIGTPTTSYHEHNERERAAELLERLGAGGRVALVSDAGTPGVSDPGYRLVAGAAERGIPVVPIPGPSAAVAALSVSGLPTDSFLFVGFLPPKRSARRARLEELVSARATLVLYEAPHRIAATLADALDVLGDREAVVGREMTKIHEEFVRGRLSRALETLDPSRRRGEFVLVIRGAADAPTEPANSSLSVAGRVAEIEASGLSRMEAIKRVARERKLPKGAVYREVLGSYSGARPIETKSAAPEAPEDSSRG
jgi:16S rRNA (cytidine1402-2'-O)-methyltransferase